ncbi:DUF6386 family protein [Salmonella enterica subsp. enterica]
MNNNFSFATDTATLAIFDLAAIKHRVSDTPDWWSISEDEIDEMNRGNILFLGLGGDGVYHVDIVDEIDDCNDCLYIKVPSGTIFIGAGEDTTGGDLEPDNSENTSGVFLNLKTGNYLVKFKRVSDTILLSFASADRNFNELSSSICL